MGSVLGILRWLDVNLEKWILILAYVTCAGIVFVEVIRRFFFNEQAPWSTSVPAYMFLWLTWLGCSYAVKLRAHLRFAEFRERMPRGLQYALLQLDYVFYIVFGVVVIYWASDLLDLQMMNESVVPGTDNLPAWWFYLATPVGWTLLLFRVLQCAVQDFIDFRQGRPIRSGAALSS